MSQREIENDYYLVDIPMLLRQKAAAIAEERLIALHTAAVIQGGDKDAYEAFIKRLRDDLITDDDGEETEEQNGFDRTGIERLRNKLRGGR